ncbi:MAG: DUF4892 domain-containing protein [Candidatus Firestonebacteria bacterium]
MLKKFIFLLFCVMGIGFSQEVVTNEDIQGSNDHPLISRYAGSKIMRYSCKDFDEYKLPLGGLNAQMKLSKYMRLEGKITRITYAVSQKRSTLEIYRNYEQALKKVGFEFLFSGSGEQIASIGILWVSAVYNTVEDYDLIGYIDIQRHLSAKLSRQEGDVYISLYVSSSAQYSYPVVRLDVIELKSMEDNLVAVNAEFMASRLKESSHISIYGICFDSGKTEVKPESETTIKEIVKLLNNNSKLNLYVVGHTDNVGTFDFNMSLSKGRADAVVNVLTTKYNISKERLIPVGIGPVSPVTTNKTEKGKAKNRRVELVEQ